MNAFDKNANVNFICMTLLVIVCKSNARLLKTKQVPCIFLLDTIIGVRTHSDLAGSDPLSRNLINAQCKRRNWEIYKENKMVNNSHLYLNSYFQTSHTLCPL